MSEFSIAALAASLLENFILNIGSFGIDLILAFISFMPTDPFTGLLDVASEPFYQFMPYVNWFIPINYFVILIGSVLDAYALMIVFKYLKKIISSLLKSSGNISKIIGYMIQ